MNPDPLLAVLRDIEKPPGGWRYTVPETGVTLSGDFFAELWPLVVKHHAANGLPAPDRETVEDGACRQSPGGRCGARKPKPVAENHPVPLLSSVNSFLSAVWGTLKERQFVSKEEAERRASICRGCPYRGHSPGGCLGCHSLIRKANDLVDRNPIKFEPDEDGKVRDTCMACLCLCHIKVWLPSKVLDKAEGSTKPNYHQSCWRLEKRSF